MTLKMSDEIIININNMRVSLIGVNMFFYR